MHLCVVALSYAIVAAMLYVSRYRAVTVIPYYSYPSVTMQLILLARYVSNVENNIQYDNRPTAVETVSNNTKWRGLPERYKAHHSWPPIVTKQ